MVVRVLLLSSSPTLPSEPLTMTATAGTKAAAAATSNTRAEKLIAQKCNDQNDKQRLHVEFRDSRVARTTARRDRDESRSTTARFVRRVGEKFAVSGTRVNGRRVAVMR